MPLTLPFAARLSVAFLYHSSLFPHSSIVVSTGVYGYLKERLYLAKKCKSEPLRLYDRYAGTLFYIQLSTTGTQNSRLGMTLTDRLSAEIGKPERRADPDSAWHTRSDAVPNDET